MTAPLARFPSADARADAAAAPAGARPAPRRRLVLLLVALALLLLAACGGTAAKKPKVDAMTEYGTAIRWGEFDAALGYVDPTGVGGSALTDLERERFKQLQVTGYDVKATRTLPDGGMEQDVEIRVVNRNTQRERAIMDHQRWRWDPAAKRFWLVSGLPDFGSGL